jgi:hypothetical protein
MTEESQLGPSWNGTVMLDIGGDVGALILHTGADLHLAEIELERVDGADANLVPHRDAHGHEHAHAGGRTHVAVRERRGPAGVRYAAIYPALRQGDYMVFDPTGAPKQTVTVVGGEVAELDWS